MTVNKTKNTGACLPAASTNVIARTPSEARGTKPSASPRGEQSQRMRLLRPHSVRARNDGRVFCNFRAQTRPHIFLDRDGVVNRNPIRYDYVKKPSEFQFLPGVLRAVRMLTDAGFDIVIISNQAGVAKKLFSREDLRRIDDKMMRGIKAAGGRIRKSYYCIHRPDAGCGCRKPRTGLVKKAVGKRRIEHKKSYFIGDTERDVATGKSFGLKTITVLSGYNSRKDIRSWKVKPDFISRNLLSAAKEIILKE